MYFKVALSVLILFISNCTETRSNFYVFNKDAETIDRLHIFVGDKTYLIEDLLPKKSKSLKINNLGGKKISFQADDGKLMPLTGTQKSPFRGTLKFIITKERVVSGGTYSN